VTICSTPEFHPKAKVPPNPSIPGKPSRAAHVER
jgi:hypothetical protein